MGTQANYPDTRYNHFGNVDLSNWYTVCKQVDTRHSHTTLALYLAQPRPIMYLTTQIPILLSIKSRGSLT